MFKKFQKKNKKRGFTLIELIVVIAILAILAAVLIPTLSGVIGESQMKVNKANANSVYSAAKYCLTIMNTSDLKISETAEKVEFKNTDTDALMVKVKENLGAGFGTSSDEYSFVLNADKTDVLRAVFNGVVYDPANPDATTVPPAATGQ